MSGTVPIACCNCGAPLRVPDSLKVFSCTHCGSSQQLKVEGGVAYSTLVDGLTKVREGTDRTAAELAIKRLTREIQRLEDQYKADVANAKSTRELHHRMEYDKSPEVARLKAEEATLETKLENMPTTRQQGPATFLALVTATCLFLLVEHPNILGTVIVVVLVWAAGLALTAAFNRWRKGSYEAKLGRVRDALRQSSVDHMSNLPSPVDCEADFALQAEEIRTKKKQLAAARRVVDSPQG